MRYHCKWIQDGTTPHRLLLHDDICHMIRLKDFKHWAWRGAGILIHLRGGWQTLLHSKQSVGTAMLLEVAQANTNHSVGGAGMCVTIKIRYKMERPRILLLQDPIGRLEALGFGCSTRRRKYLDRKCEIVK